jgi:hypothetical protein
MPARFHVRNAIASQRHAGWFSERSMSVDELEAMGLCSGCHSSIESCECALQAFTIGRRVVYEDISTPIRIGTIVQDEYRISWDGGGELISDMRQPGWRAIP